MPVTSTGVVKHHQRVIVVGSKAEATTSKGGVQRFSIPTQSAVHVHETLDENEQTRSVTAVHITCHVELFTFNRVRPCGSKSVEQVTAFRVQSLHIGKMVRYVLPKTI